MKAQYYLLYLRVKQTNPAAMTFSSQNRGTSDLLRRGRLKDADIDSIERVFKAEDTFPTTAVDLTENEKEILVVAISDCLQRYKETVKQWDCIPDAAGHSVDLIRLLHKFGFNYFRVDHEEVC